jgi:putative transposase
VSRFRRLSHTIWHCQYHIVWAPKYRHRVIDGPIREATYKGVHAICGYTGSEVVEMNVQKDHIHLVVMVPPKISISDLMGRLKGQTAIKIFKQFPELRQKPYWGNQLWSKSYCVDTVGLDEEMIRKYVKYQEEKDRYIDQLKFGFR